MLDRLHKDYLRAILLSLFDFLNLRDVLALRLTCKLVKNVISKPLVEDIVRVYRPNVIRTLKTKKETSEIQLKKCYTSHLKGKNVFVLYDIVQAPKPKNAAYNLAVRIASSLSKNPPFCNDRNIAYYDDRATYKWTWVEGDIQICKLQQFGTKCDTIVFYSGFTSFLLSIYTKPIQQTAFYIQFYLYDINDWDLILLPSYDENLFNAIWTKWMRKSTKDEGYKRFVLHPRYIQLKRDDCFVFINGSNEVHIFNKRF